MPVGDREQSVGVAPGAGDRAPALQVDAADLAQALDQPSAPAGERVDLIGAISEPLERQRAEAAGEPAAVELDAFCVTEALDPEWIAEHGRPTNVACAIG